TNRHGEHLIFINLPPSDNSELLRVYLQELTGEEMIHQISGNRHIQNLLQEDPEPNFDAIAELKEQQAFFIATIKRLQALVPNPYTTAPSKESPSTLAFLWERLYPGEAYENIRSRGHRETRFLTRAIISIAIIYTHAGVPQAWLEIGAIALGSLWGLL